MREYKFGNGCTRRLWCRRESSILVYISSQFLKIILSKNLIPSYKMDQCYVFVLFSMVSEDKSV